MRSLLTHSFLRFFRYFTESTTRISLALFIVLIVSSTLLLSFTKVGVTYSYKIGDIVKETIRVPWDISYHLENETERERQRAKDAVPLVFDMNRYVLLEKIHNINDLFYQIDSVISDESYYALENPSVKVAVIQKSLPESSTYAASTINALIEYKDLEEIRHLIVKILNDIYETGILEEEYSNPLNLSTEHITVRTITDTDEYLEERRPLDSLRTLAIVNENLNTICLEYTEGYPENLRWAVYLVVRKQIIQNVRFNPEETNSRITAAIENVQPVMGVLKKGQVIVREGDPVTSDSMKLIDTLNRYTSKINIRYMAGVFLVQLVFYLLFIFFLRDTNVQLFDNKKTVLVSTILLVFFFVYSFVVNRTIGYEEKSLLFPLYLPIPFVTLIITILFSTSAAMVCGLYMLFFTITITAGDYASVVIAFSSAFISIFSVKTIEKRFDFLKTGLIIGIVNSIIVFAIAMIREMSYVSIIGSLQLAMAAGIVNTIVAMGVFPVFENIFSLTTRFKLFELSDLNAPIFKQMLIQAPGTYNHSILVANMAEAACKEIHANSLLARVGAYYHDIGKLDNPQIFIENKKENAHINLSTSEYTRKIIRHVDRGVAMAGQMRLPHDIINFIREHHGDSIVTYFYHKALESAQRKKGNTVVDEKDFSYPGPKPQTKETAVVMLADSVEAASRSIAEPTESKLMEMINKIVYNRLNQGDLEHSNITMQELHQVKMSFLKILSGIFHTRMEYPERDEILDLEKKVKHKK